MARAVRDALGAEVSRRALARRCARPGTPNQDAHARDPCGQKNLSDSSQSGPLIPVPPLPFITTAFDHTTMGKRQQRARQRARKRDEAAEAEAAEAAQRAFVGCSLLEMAPGDPENAASARVVSQVVGVGDDHTCSVCLERVPSHRVDGRCEHAFCRPCASGTAAVCPECRAESGRGVRFAWNDALRVRCGGCDKVFRLADWSALVEHRSACQGFRFGSSLLCPAGCGRQEPRELVPHLFTCERLARGRALPKWLREKIHDRMRREDAVRPVFGIIKDLARETGLLHAVVLKTYYESCLIRGPSSYVHVVSHLPHLCDLLCDPSLDQDSVRELMLGGLEACVALVRGVDRRALENLRESYHFGERVHLELKEACSKVLARMTRKLRADVTALMRDERRGMGAVLDDRMMALCRETDPSLPRLIREARLLYLADVMSGQASECLAVGVPMPRVVRLLGELNGLVARSMLLEQPGQFKSYVLTLATRQQCSALEAVRLLDASRLTQLVPLPAPQMRVEFPVGPDQGVWLPAKCGACGKKAVDACACQAFGWCSGACRRVLAGLCEGKVGGAAAELHFGDSASCSRVLRLC